MMPARNKAMDTVGGIMILFMILRHCLIGTMKTSVFGGVVAYYPLLFFMAWFFFKGGMYYREETLPVCISKGFWRLLVPYVVFSAIAVIVAMIVRGCVSGMAGISDVIGKIPVYLKREGAVECNAPLWFLLSLFLVRVFFSFAHNLHIPAWLVAGCSLFAAWGLYKADFPIGQFFENIPMGLCFFALGYLLKDRQYSNYTFIPSVVIFLGYLVYCCWTREVVGTFNTNTHTPYFPTVLYYVAGCITVNNLFTRFPKLQCDFLSAIGKHSMAYYTTHFIIIISVLYVNERIMHLTDIQIFFVLLVLEALLLPFIGRLFRKPQLEWMTGEGKIKAKPLVNNKIVAYVFTFAVMIAMSAYVMKFVLPLL